jgi:tRNA (mo5U34)-methyltransferase
MTARVSVGIPTYNRASSLERALRSVLRQTFADLEVVVSDNCSTDATGELLERLAAEDDRIRIVRQRENIGGVANINAVIDELRGELGLLVADDDWLDETYVECCVAELDAHPDHALVAGTSRLHAPGGEVLPGQEIQLAAEDPGVRVRRFLRTVQDNSVFYGVWRTRLLQQAAPLHAVLGGDWLLVAAVAHEGKVLSIDSAHVHRTLGGTSQSVRHVLAVLGITKGPRWRFPWATTCATAFADMAWRSPAYAGMGAARRIAFAFRAAPCAMRWKGTAWQLVAPTLLALRSCPRGRVLWRAFAWVGERLGGLPLHEVDPALASGREPVATLPRVSLTESADLRARVAQVPVWWHSIDLGDGVVTPGQKSPDVLAQEAANLRLGDLTGKSVLDIGAWDGYFSFAAEAAGAERVVALDHYTWSMDLGAYGKYREQRLKDKLPVVAPELLPEYWHPDTLPGRAGFDLAKEARGSKVEPIVGDILDLDFDLEQLGQFDVVLYLGVLYHVKHPLLALERLSQITRGTLIIETQAETFRGLENKAICRFFEGSELNGDPSNWWVYNTRALVDLCRAAGFSTVEVVQGPSTARRAYATVMGGAPFRATVRAAK